MKWWIDQNSYNTDKSKGRDKKERMHNSDIRNKRGLSILANIKWIVKGMLWTPDPDDFIGKFYQKFKEKIASIIQKQLSENRRKKITQLLPWSQRYTDTQIQTKTVLENYRSKSRMNICPKILNKILVNESIFRYRYITTKWSLFLEF